MNIIDGSISAQTGLHSVETNMIVVLRTVMLDAKCKFMLRQIMALDGTNGTGRTFVATKLYQVRSKLVSLTVLCERSTELRGFAKLKKNSKNPK